MKRHLLQKCLVMVGGEGTTHTEQSVFFSFFSLFLCFLHSSSSFFLFLHLLCFFLMGHWKHTHTHTHTQAEKCLINFYKMNTCVITTQVEKQNTKSALETSQVLFPIVSSSIILDVNVTPNLITFICSKARHRFHY